jgi:N-acetylneuraminic acid mutarotase
MNRPRSGVQLVQYDCYIYAIGGNDGITRQTSIEKYDPKRNNWILLSNMRTARSNFACAVLENQIYVIGGFNVCLAFAKQFIPFYELIVILFPINLLGIDHYFRSRSI